MEAESIKDVRAKGELPEPRLGQLAPAGATTVDGYMPDTEECLIDQQRWEAIHARRGAGVAIAQIAREFEGTARRFARCYRRSGGSGIDGESGGPA